MAGNAQNGSGLPAGKVGSEANQPGGKGFRDGPAYNIILGVIVIALAVGVCLILRAQYSKPDGPELLTLTQLRVQKQVEKYLAQKVIKTDAVEGIPKDLSFKATTLRFTTPDVVGSNKLPDIIQFEMDLATTGAPEGKQGQVKGYFDKSIGEMMLNYDLIYMHDSVPSSYGAWDEE